MTAPAPLDAAVREAENALAIEANCITPRCPECFPRFRESLRSLLAALSADKRLEEKTEMFEQYVMRLAAVLTVLDGAGLDIAPPPGTPEPFAPYVSNCPTYAAAHRQVKRLEEAEAALAAVKARIQADDDDCVMTSFIVGNAVAIIDRYFAKEGRP